MYYITHILKQSYTRADTRMTTQEMLMAQLYPDQVKGSKHSRNFFEMKTFFSLSEKNRDAWEVLFNGALRTLLSTEYVKEYIQFRIPKASGGTRLIEAPAMPLKNLQREVAQLLLRNFEILPHSAAYAYTRGRCAYDALVTHQRGNARWFLKLDIKDFFPSISAEVLMARLKDVYPLYYLPQDLMAALVNLATNEQGVLPQGSPLSPILSNLILVGFDHRLTQRMYRFTHQTFTYTRYADDLLISSPYEFKFEDVVKVVEESLTEFHLPLTINRQKLRYASMSGSNWNLGLMYNKDQQITIGSKKKRMLHSLLNNFVVDYKNQEQWSVTETQELIGKLAYLNTIEPEYYSTIVRKYEEKYQVRMHLIFKEVLNQ